MTANDQVSIGETLRAAREAQGMSLEEAAARLRLMHRQVSAMEADELESLGQPVFARGFVRNYARLLDIPSAPLLAHMEGAPADPPVMSRAAPPAPSRWFGAPWIILLGLGLAVAIGVPAGLYFWLNSEPADSAEIELTPPSVQVPPSAAAPEFASSAADAPNVQDAPVVQPVAPALATLPPVANEAPVVATPAPSAVLHLEFSDEAWVEIKDASGRVLHRQLNRPGSQIDLSGQPPFDLLLGNAAHARVTYNNRVVDLRPFIDGTVARFTLEE